MFSEHLRQLAEKSPLLVYPILSLIIFSSFFVGVLVYVGRRGRALESHGLLPLERDGHE